jgi:general secretion pathway protein D
MRSLRIITVLITIFFLFSCFSPALAQEDPQQGQDEENLVEAARIMRDSGRAQFNFSEIDIVSFIRFMSELLDENIIVPPSIKGEISVLSPHSVSLDEARQIMLSVLEMNGLTLQEMGDYSKIVSLKQGASSENIIRKSRTGPGIGEQVVSQVVPLKYVTSDFIAEAVKQASGKDVGIFPVGTGNEILLSGRAADVNRAVSLIQTLDVATSIRRSESVSLEHASPRLVAAHLSNLAKDKAGPLSNLVALADDSSGQIILVGERDTIAEAKAMISSLDVPARGGDFHVYRLQNADAETVAEQLSEILSVASRLKPAQGEAEMPSTVVADIPTNSLIFAAQPSQFQSIVNIIEKIDIQPKQVMLRGLIAEVNITKLNDAGIDWATWGGTVTGDAYLATQAQLGNASVPSEFIEYFRDLTTVEERVYDETTDTWYDQTTYDSKALIYSYIKMTKQFDAINVLSMPRLLCTDNMESELQVGQVIPQLSSKVSDITNPNSVQNSYEYKDTGLILTVTPHIRSGGLVTLEIEQSTEEVLSAMTSDTPVTAKRKIKTTAQVGNGETIILGGLIREAEKSMKQRVPGLSYIPLIGNLFKSSTKQKEKVELMLFLTPYIIDKPSDAEQLTREIVISGDHGMGEAERNLQQRLEMEYQKIIERESR